MAKVQTNPAHTVEPNATDIKILRGFNSLSENTRRKLQQTAMSELEKIRSTMERQTSKQKTQQEVEAEDLRRRSEVLKNLEARIERSNQSRSQNIRIRKQSLKSLHIHVKEVGEKRKQMQKQKNKQIRKLREAAINDLITSSKQRDNKMRSSFLSIQHSKVIYPQAISKKTNLYLSNMAFADQSRDQVFQRLQRANKNYIHHQIQRQNAFTSQRSRQSSIYNNADHISNSKEKHDINELIVSLKRSELTLDRNEHDYEEKMKTLKYNMSEKWNKIKENRNILQKSMIERAKMTKLRLQHTSSKNLRDSVTSEQRDKFELLRMQTSKSFMRDTQSTNFYSLVTKHKAQIQENATKRTDDLVNQQNELTTLLKNKSELLERASSLKRYALSNRDRINPEQVHTLY